jgi:hypothetical protein
MDKKVEGHAFHYTVDGEPQTTTDHTLTARRIVSLAGLNAEERYLVLIDGKHQQSYQDKMDSEFHMHDAMVFVTVLLGPMPVS